MDQPFPRRQGQAEMQDSGIADSSLLYYEVSAAKLKSGWPVRGPTRLPHHTAHIATLAIPI